MSVLAAPAFGDVRALRDDAVTLRGRARAAERLAHVVRRTDVGWWSGEASDAFGEALSVTARRLLCAADDALAAAQALERHADVVAWARDEASGPIGSPLEHEALLLELRDAVRVSAEKAAAALRAIAEGIERLPDGWDVAAYMRDQYWTGMGESLLGMVEGSWQVQTFRFVTDPFGFAAEQQLIGQALHAGARDDPVGLARDMVGWDTWRTEPVRAVGQQIPDLLLSAATAGAGGAAAGGRRALTSVKAAAEAVEEASPAARKPDLGQTPVRPVPEVVSPKLQNLVNDLFKGVDNPRRVGDGTTMDAVRREAQTGEPTHGRLHLKKANEVLRGLNNWLRRHPDGDPHDRTVAQSLADELRRALEGR